MSALVAFIQLNVNWLVKTATLNERGNFSLFGFDRKFTNVSPAEKQTRQLSIRASYETLCETYNC